MKKLLLMFVAIAAFAATADAQGFLKKLKDKAIERVQDKIENKVERETDDAMDGRIPPRLLHHLISNVDLL